MANFIIKCGGLCGSTPDSEGCNTCGCQPHEKCIGESECKKGTCFKGDIETSVKCSCCEPGYAKVDSQGQLSDDGECEFLSDSCPSNCMGGAIDCTDSWEDCGCEETTTTCIAFEGDTSGAIPGEAYTASRTAEENTQCIYSADLPGTAEEQEDPDYSPRNYKGFVSGQDRKSCCGTCIQELRCPEPVGGGGHMCDCLTSCESVILPDDPTSAPKIVNACDNSYCVEYLDAFNCTCYQCAESSSSADDSGCPIDDDPDYCTNNFPGTFPAPNACECITVP